MNYNFGFLLEMWSNQFDSQLVVIPLQAKPIQTYLLQLNDFITQRKVLEREISHPQRQEALPFRKESPKHHLQ